MMIEIDAPEAAILRVFNKDDRSYDIMITIIDIIKVTSTIGNVNDY
jgi:hypothetical protein